MKKYVNSSVAALGIVIFLMGCGSHNEHLSKGKELIKSEKRRKEERAVKAFQLAIQQEPTNAEAHYLLGYYNSQAFYDSGSESQDWEAASVEERGLHLFKAYQENKRKYREILVFETLRDNDMERQLATLDALKRIYQQGGVDRQKLLDALEKAIKSKDNRDRHDAHWVLAEIGKMDADTIVPRLLSLLNRKRRMGTRLNAVKALGEIGSEKAIDDLVDIVKSGSNKREKDRAEPEVRRLAVEALGKIGGRAVEKLVEIAENKGSSLRVDAIQALAKLGDEQAVRPLLEVLGEQGSREVKVQ